MFKKQAAGGWWIDPQGGVHKISPPMGHSEFAYEELLKERAADIARRRPTAEVRPDGSYEHKGKSGEVAKAEAEAELADEGLVPTNPATSDALREREWTQVTDMGSTAIVRSYSPDHVTMLANQIKDILGDKESIAVDTLYESSDYPGVTSYGIEPEDFSGAEESISRSFRRAPGDRPSQELPEARRVEQSLNGLGPWVGKKNKPIRWNRT
jgi:hypothetical protein